MSHTLNAENPVCRQKYSKHYNYFIDLVPLLILLPYEKTRQKQHLHAQTQLSLVFASDDIILFTFEENGYRRWFCLYQKLFFAGSMPFEVC